MDKIKEQLAGVAALIGVVAAIGAGFIKYGEVMAKIDSLNAVDLAPIEKKFNTNDKKVAILEKEIELLKVQIKEIRSKNSNPLAN